MFLPINKNDLKKLGWEKLDIIFVSGDAYIDSPYCGVALLGKLLIKNGYRVGVISQPDLNSSKDILSLGVPELFWGISAGAVDSMVANYTPLMKKRRDDDFTPGGINSKRPDRATIKYVNLVRQFDKSKTPVVIGGIEASLRRFAHYDYWDDAIRRGILFDSKADILVYGMGELAVLELANKLKAQEDYKDIKGICYIAKEKVDGFIELPSFEEVSMDKEAFTKSFSIFYGNNDPITAKGLVQQHGDRYLIQNPPQRILTQHELDEIYELDFEHDIHPEIKKMGKIKALDTIKFSITINRGCYGECNFCAISVHQGATVVSRSPASIKREIQKIKKLTHFNGIIKDLGGPTANMYMMECDKKLKHGKCLHKRCLFESGCKQLPINHLPLINLMKDLRNEQGIKKIFISSGLRYDMVLNDHKYGHKYMEDLIKYHTSGQLKIAPEHISKEILKIMGKPVNPPLNKFIDLFYSITAKHKLKYFLTYYFIAAHPGCELKHMIELKNYIKKYIKLTPEQVQIFTPLPSTWSSVYYYTEKADGKNVFVEKGLKGKRTQKEAVTKATI